MHRPSARTSGLLSLLATGLILAGLPAVAEPTGLITLRGALTRNCDLNAVLDGPFDAIDMNSTDVQGDEILTTICNYGGTPTIEFTSLNAGVLKSGSESVPYVFIVSGGLFTGPLTTPATVFGWPVWPGLGDSRTLAIRLDFPAPVAGVYSDNITAQVTPN